MHILVDGYNVLHAMGLMRPQLGRDGLKKARIALLGRIAGALRDEAAAVTVVFDARNPPDQAVPTETHRGVKVVYSQGVEADERIETLLKGYAAAQVTVVSGDRRLRSAARRHGARSQAPAEFLEWLDRAYRPPPGATDPPEKEKGLIPGQEEQWLREFGHLDVEPGLGDRLPWDD